jgi:hypothetical protein
MDVSSVNGSTQAQNLSQILLMATQQQTALTTNLLKMGTANAINENQLATMGSLVDTYA